MDSTAPISEAPLPHRSTKACQRCKRKKIRCRYLGSHINTCTACEKSGSECLFDFGTEKLHAAQGSEYIAALEARVKLLEQELATRGPKLDNQEGSDLGNIEDDTSTPALTPTPTKVTLFTIAQRNRVPPSGTLPPQHTADQLFDTAYRYTLARYCILDWVRVRKWHENRDAVCFASQNDDIDLQLGAFFLWIVYAIGAQLTANTENPPELYYGFATGYLRKVLQQQGAITVQAFLALVQYHFRASTGPSLWQLAGAGMRLCIELGYHRRQSPLIYADPYKLELEKRLFWCSYCFDRIVSIMLRRPFGIQDIDITCNTPANVDDYCTDREVLQSAQMLDGSYTTTMTTLSALLHHLQIYRIRSRILTTYANPESSELNSEDIFKQIEELETWRQNSPSCPRGSGIPYQSSVRIDSIYYQALMLLFRPIIAKSTVEERLLLSCASLSIDACEAMRRLSLDFQTQNSPITVYNCFRCGVTLLQCVTLQRNILPMRRIMHAIIACSGALTVYTRTLALALPFLELFDKLSDYFLSAEEYTPPTDLHSLLQYVTRSDPSEIPQILDSLSNTTIEQTAGLPLEQMEPEHFDFLFGMDPALCFPMGTMTPNSTAAALSDVMNTNELWRDTDG